MTKGSSAARQDLRKRRGLSKLEQGYMGFVLILPWLIGFCIFKLYPFVSSLVYSFTDYDLFRGVQNVVGFQNYIDAFTKAKNVKALKVTFTYAFMTVPLKLIFALFIAYILNFKIKGVGLFRTAYYVPSILGGSVAIAVLWKALFKNDGVVNTILTMLGFESINFLADKNWALFIICLLRVWQFGSAMVLFLAALKGVTDPEQKRKIIGAEFVRVFEEESKKLPDVKFLAQGTIYPDVIESGGSKAATIKSHHNVGGLPKDMRFEGVVEPLRGLFKDEVRALGRQLGLPRRFVERQPFPGPGLAVRVIDGGNPHHVLKRPCAQL